MTADGEMLRAGRKTRADWRCEDWLVQKTMREKAPASESGRHKFVRNALGGGRGDRELAEGSDGGCGGGSEWERDCAGMGGIEN